MSTEKKIVTYEELADAMVESVVLWDATYRAKKEAQEAVATAESLKEQAEKQQRKVMEAMDRLDVKSSGNYGWEPRFMLFMKAMVESAKE